MTDLDPRDQAVIRLEREIERMKRAHENQVLIALGGGLVLGALAVSAVGYMACSLH